MVISKFINLYRCYKLEALTFLSPRKVKPIDDVSLHIVFLSKMCNSQTSSGNFQKVIPLILTAYHLSILRTCEGQSYPYPLLPPAHMFKDKSLQRNA